MGEAVAADYGLERTFAKHKNAEKLFRDLEGYTNVGLVSCNLDMAREMIYIKKLPFYYLGESSTDGHAFVLQGWLRQERKVTARYIGKPVENHTETRSFVHVNYGWGGSRDGYYYFNSFTTDYGPIHVMSNEDYNYTRNLASIIYNLI